MTIFVHLTSERNVDKILRQGITRMRAQADHPAGIFAMPAARSFHVSHQWLHELKERGHVRVAAMYFRVSDSEQVWVGHYRGCHEQITAKEAMERFQREMRPRGFEVIVPRRISVGEIYRVHHLARVLPLDRILRANQGTSLEAADQPLQSRLASVVDSGAVSSFPEF
jgi:hypothetical protein